MYERNVAFKLCNDVAIKVANDVADDMQDNVQRYANEFKGRFDWKLKV